MTAFRAAALAAAFILSSPAHAEAPSGCGEPQKAKKSSFGSMFAAAREAGLAQALGSSPEGQAAMALLSGDAATAVAAIPGSNRDARTAQLASAVASMATGVARSARNARTEACASAASAENDPPSADSDVWR